MKIHDSAIDRFEQAIHEEQDRLSQDFFQSLQTRMEELNMSQSDMAFTLGKSRAYVSKLFSKGQNLTIKTMVELAQSLDMKVAISTRAIWLEAMSVAKTTPLQCKGWTPNRTLSLAPTQVRRTGAKGDSTKVSWGDHTQQAKSPLLQQTS